jgi:hypothetical protein
MILIDNRLPLFALWSLLWAIWCQYTEIKIAFSKIMANGHVFVVHGDLSKLSCDAWMVDRNNS